MTRNITNKIKDLYNFYGFAFEKIDKKIFFTKNAAVAQQKNILSVNPKQTKMKDVLEARKNVYFEHMFQ